MTEQEAIDALVEAEKRAVRAEAERDAARSERDAALNGQHAALNAHRARLDEVTKERDEALAQTARVVEGYNENTQRNTDALAGLRAQRDKALAERGAAVKEANWLRDERDAARFERRVTTNTLRRTTEQIAAALQHAQGFLKIPWVERLVPAEGRRPEPTSYEVACWLNDAALKYAKARADDERAQLEGRIPGIDSFTTADELRRAAIIYAERRAALDAGDAIPSDPKPSKVEGSIPEATRRLAGAGFLKKD